MRKEVLIRCPHCGTEYLPAEIFYPNSFLGKPSNIEKTSCGNIEYYDGKNMDLSEEYMCDKCNTTFVVKSQVIFFTKAVEEKSFSENYKTKLKKSEFTLNED